MKKTVNKKLFPYLEKVLERRDIPYTLRPSPNDGEVVVNIMSTSGKVFHRAVARALCEMRNAKEHLEDNETYWKPGVEKKAEIQAENPDFQFFRDYQKTEASN